MPDESTLPPRATRIRYHRAQSAHAAPVVERAPWNTADPVPASDCGVGMELTFVSVVLAVFFALFYHRWPIWEDQAIYHYMAWGLSHGLVPYRDAINMNWPGSLGIHLLARAVSGADGLGLRLVDSVFLIVLSAASSLLLRAYGVGAPIRLLCLTSYLLAYFLTDFRQTAQRESFALPLVAVGLACCLIRARATLPPSRRVALGCGLAAGLGLSIKPTLALPLLFAQTLPVLCQPARRESYRFVSWFTLGEVGAGLCLVLFLVGFGSPSGFWEWGVRYVFGPYATVKWPIAQRLYHTLDWSLWAPPVILALAGAGVILSGRFDRREPLRWQGPVVFGILALLALGTVLAQGKTHCRYHYHPFFWALALFGGAALQAGLRPADALVDTRLSAAFCLALLGMLALDTTYRRPQPLPDGTVLAASLRERLAPDDEFVLFGFAPTFHSRIERRTPFPYIDSWVVLSCCGDSAQERVQRLVGQSLAAAVRQPQVKCVVLQRQQFYAANNQWITIGSIEAKYVPDRDLEALGYARTHVHMAGGADFDVWLRGSASRTASAPARRAELFPSTGDAAGSRPGRLPTRLASGSTRRNEFGRPDYRR